MKSAVCAKLSNGYFALPVFACATLQDQKVGNQANAHLGWGQNMTIIRCFGILAAGVCPQIRPRTLGQRNSGPPQNIIPVGCIDVGLLWIPPVALEVKM